MPNYSHKIILYSLYTWTSRGSRANFACLHNYAHFKQVLMKLVMKPTRQWRLLRVRLRRLLTEITQQYTEYNYLLIVSTPGAALCSCLPFTVRLLRLGLFMCTSIDYIKCSMHFCSWLSGINGEALLSVHCRCTEISQGTKAVWCWCRILPCLYQQYHLLVSRTLS